VRKLAVGGAVLLAALFLAAVAGPGNACVGRTIQVGYFDSPEQELVANILSVFIDERTGTTVRLSRYETRDEVFDAIKRDKISLYADYSDIRRRGGVGRFRGRGG
jgi:osmoprotectant transport system substrate-binding protein